MIDKSLLPPHWDEEFKKDFINQLEIFINGYYTKIMEQYSEGNMFKVTKSTPSMNIFLTILRTLSLERLVDSGLPEPPFIDVDIYNVNNYPTFNLNPGTLIFEEGTTLLYAFPEKPVFLTNNISTPVRARIYATDSPMGTYTGSITKVKDLLADRGVISKVFVFSVSDVRGSVGYVKYIPYTTNVLDFYDTFRKDDAKDILVIPSYNGMIRVYCSDRLIEKYRDSDLTLRYMNMPSREFTESPLSPNFFNEIYPRKALVYLTMTIRSDSDLTEQYFMTYKPVRNGVSTMRYLPHISRYNKTIRSITDIGTAIMEMDEYTHEFKVFKYLYSHGTYRGYKYFITLINNDKIKKKENMVEWYSRIKKIKKMFNLTLPSLNINYLYLYQNLNWNLTQINDINGNIYTDAIDLIKKTDVFITCLHPITILIKYDVDSYNKTLVNNSFMKIMGRYVNIISENFPLKEIMSLISKIYSVNKVTEFEVKIRDGMYPSEHQILFKYPNDIPNFVNPDYYNLIDIKNFISESISLGDDAYPLSTYFKYVRYYEEYQ